MNLSSDDESSNSSTEYIRPTDKIDLNSLAFVKSAKRKLNDVLIEEEEEEEEEEYSDDEELPSYTNTELISQILKNLEETNKSLLIQNQNDSQTSQDSGIDIKEKATSSEKHNDSVTNLLLKGEQNLDLSTSSEISFTNLVNREQEKPVTQTNIEIICPFTNDLLRGRGKKKQSVQELLRNRLNKKLRAHQILIHKVGILCWLGHGFYLNRLLSDLEILAHALSLISSVNYPQGNADKNYLLKFTVWYKKNFQINKNIQREGTNKHFLLKALETKMVKDEKELVLLYVAILRAMGLNCRLVISLCPPEKSVRKDKLITCNTNVGEKKIEKNMDNKIQKTYKKAKIKGFDKNDIPENSQESASRKRLDARQKAAAILGKIKDVKKVIDKNSEQSKQICRNKLKGFEKKRKSDTENSRICDGNIDYIETDDDSDDDFQENVLKKMVSKKKIIKKNNAGNRKLLSSDEDENDNKIELKTGNYWAEIYIENESSWICMDVLTGKINSPNDIYKRAQKPVLYVVGWNSDGLLKDVSRRYCPRWLTVTRKQRIFEDWWDEAIHSWKEKKDAISRAEDELLLKKELEQPLPKTISECKGHPLYAIPRHLLKYEAFYPPDLVPLGYLPNGEPIYPRFCVHTLMSRQTWLKHARIVKPAQEAYKIVKSMSKYDKMTGTMCIDKNLELFGKWQTDTYVPPEAKDGIVPRNEFGNVDLFKKSMLPKGTVHIDLPGLVRVARKLNIDCAPAVVGFKFGCRGAVVDTEGYVVCSEFEDILRDAWKAEQVESKKRAKEKREKIIYGNWKKIIKGLLIRKRLANKYEFNDDKNKSFKKETGFEITSAKKKKM